ncbi:MAG: PD-(D/E)XK nuclease family protein [Saprospiraceae bacterium]
MHLHLGLHFDNLVFSAPHEPRAGVLYAGPKKLLTWLETQLGLNGCPENTDYLRIELYRQALLQVLETASSLPFFAASFEADRFATAEALLAWRDELLLAGWDFLPAGDCPPRLADLARVEVFFSQKTNAPEIGAAAIGWADRFARALRWLPVRPMMPLDEVVLHEPEIVLPPVLRRAVAVLRAIGVSVREARAEGAATDPHSDLAWLQGRMCGRVSGKKTATADGSLLVLRARRDSDAAVFIAQFLAKNPVWEPVFLIPEMNRALEQALQQEGFPAMGVLSASLARPALQVLKLAPAFLWEPVDVFKIMEFVTLPLKPLDDGLALEIARVLAAKPGLFSDTWFAAVLEYLEREQVPDSVREQYEFWFARRRYRADGTAPKRDALELYAYLHRGALERFSEKENATLLVLAEQARRIRDLLETLPEQRIGFLELERIVRTIYEPAPVQLTVGDSGHFPFVHQPGAFAAPAENLVWWNCLFDGTAPLPDRWQQAERNWLAAKNIELDRPQTEGLRQLLLGQRPVLQAASRLVLVVPEQAEGASALPSLLLSDIETAFDNHKALTFDLENPEKWAVLEHFATIPGRVHVGTRPTALLRPHLHIPNPERLSDSEYETPTNLEHLFYYPHRWFFRQKMRLFPTSLLSVSRDQTLLGSLAHRFFELLLKEKDCLAWDKPAVRDWIVGRAAGLLEREGATLLLYGREPERNQFLNRIQNAAWSLLTLIRSNGWAIHDTEMALEGSLSGCPIRGKADLVLRRAPDEWAVVDLKWSGAKRRKEMIQNGEDLQLVLYAKLLPPPEVWAHTAYFILEDGKMIARNKVAFRDAITTEGQWDNHADACDAIYARMEKTFAWRLNQLKNGLLELRNARTAARLDDLYAEQLLDLLEMKSEDARWDDYRVLMEV